MAIAATRNPAALRAFKQVVLEEARLAAIDWNTDEVLQIQDQAELKRLQQMLGLLIPNDDEDKN